MLEQFNKEKININNKLNNKKIINEEELLIRKISSFKLLEKVNVTIQKISNNFDISIIEKNENLKEIICYIKTWNYENKINTYDIIQKILNLKKFSLHIMNNEIKASKFHNKIIIKEFPLCEINEITLDLNCYRYNLDIIFYCKSFLFFKSLSLKNLYITNDTFPLFDRNSKINFNSLQKFSLICEKKDMFHNINDLYYNLDYCPYLIYFELNIIDNSITEEFYNLFIQKLLSLIYIKEIILKILINEDDRNKNFDIYTQNELNEKYPLLLTKKRNTILNLTIMKFPKNLI